MYGDHPVMAAGDGYTFWKDMIEPVLVILLAGVLLAGRVEWFAAGAGLFFLFEIFWGFLMMRAVRDVFFSGAVFFFRSFARTAGFLLGGAAAFLAACNKDKKKTKNACGSMTLC
jgi:hypothetical protein